MSIFNFFVKNFNRERVVLGTLLLIILLNAVIAILYVFNKQLDSDEFQHMHIVWNMFHNGKVIYRDFWEHHGVIYPVVNYLLFKALNLQADFSTFYVFRLVSFVYMVIILALTYAIASVTFKNKLVSLLSVAVLSSLFFFQIKGIEMRPDTLQNVFWLGGLYLVLAHIQKFNRYSFFLSGILFGLAFCTNTKAAFGIAFVFLFFLGELIFSKDHRKEILLRTGLILAGICTVQGVVLLCFAYLHGLHAYFESNFVFNVIMAGKEHAFWALKLYLQEMWFHQLPFLLLVSLGLILILVKLVFKLEKEKILFITVTLGCLLGIFLGLYLQFWIMFLPLLAIVGSYFINEFLHLTKDIRLSKWVCLILVCVYFFMMEKYLVSDILLRMTDVALLSDNQKQVNLFRNLSLLQLQKSTGSFILSATSRSESIGLFWNECGGYSFNEDVQYYWGGHSLHNSVSTEITGYNTFDAEFTQNLINKDVRYVVLDPEQLPTYAGKAYEYIVNNYHYVGRCILEKNS